MRKKVRMINFPELRQTFDYTCGASALQSILAYYGFDEVESDIADLLGSDPELGTDPKDIIRVANSYGIKTKEGKFTIDKLKKCIDNDLPVMITLQAWFDDLGKTDWETDYSGGHYVIPIGYSDKIIIFEDPSAINRTFLTYTELDARWHDIDRYNNKLEHWGCVFYGLKPKWPLNKIIHMD